MSGNRGRGCRQGSRSILMIISRNDKCSAHYYHSVRFFIRHLHRISLAESEFRLRGHPDIRHNGLGNRKSRRKFLILQLFLKRFLMKSEIFIEKYCTFAAAWGRNPELMMH